MHSIFPGFVSNLMQRAGVCLRKREGDWKESKHISTIRSYFNSYYPCQRLDSRERSFEFFSCIQLYWCRWNQITFYPILNKKKSRINSWLLFSSSVWRCKIYPTICGLHNVLVHFKKHCWIFYRICFPPHAVKLCIVVQEIPNLSPSNATGDMNPSQKEA